MRSSSSTHRKRLTGATALALFGFGIALVVPATAAFAVPPDPDPYSIPGVTVTSKVSPYAITVDCGTDVDDYGYLAIRDDETVTITTVNCTDYYLGAVDRTGDLGLPLPGYEPGITPTPGSFISAVIGDTSDKSDSGDQGAPPPAVFTVNANTYVALYGGDGQQFGLSVLAAPLLENPSGTLGITRDVTLNATNALQFEAIEPLNDGDDVILGGNELCAMEVGPHAYTTTTVDISLAGEYSFRLVNTDTLTRDLQFWQQENSMRDPFLALYGAFDPANPNAGVIGCNDDLKDLPTSPFSDAGLYAYLTESDQLIGGRYPQFVANLQPGSYTLVYTAYTTISAEDWALEDAQSIGTFEMWGPEGGFSPIPAPAPVLANTGFNATLPLTAGLALMVAGGALFVARRRLAS